MAENSNIGTPFSAIYNCFLGKITDDMYIELTPQDTIKDLRSLLIASIPGFEFPRVDIETYTIDEVIMDEAQVTENDFVIGVVWNELQTDELDDSTPYVLVEKSSFSSTLTSEEINILALLMKQGWVQRQVTSIENTRMKYSGQDFKFTSQANHLSKLMSLLEESRRDSFHMQRLYRRRKKNKDTGTYESNWSVLRSSSVLG